MTDKFSINHVEDPAKEYHSTLFVKLWALLRFGVFEEYGVGKIGYGVGQNTDYPLDWLDLNRPTYFGPDHLICYHISRGSGAIPLRSTWVTYCTVGAI